MSDEEISTRVTDAVERVERETYAQKRDRRLLTTILAGFLVVGVAITTVQNQIMRNDIEQDRVMVECHVEQMVNLHSGLKDELENRSRQLSWVGPWQTEFEKWDELVATCGEEHEEP